MEIREIETPQGPARARVQATAGAPAALVLGHGAGGSVGAPDLQATAEVALDLGLTVVLVEQPYRVAGRRSTPRPPVLDAAWTAVVRALRLDAPLIVGGRSSGARVACRTAGELGAGAVLCLAFPLIAPSGASRLEELDGVRVPSLVVQGRSDRFGMPPEGPDRTVTAIAGDHALRNRGEVSAAVRPWLEAVVPAI